MESEFRSYARAVVENARVLAEVLMSGGLRLMTGGTDNHLVLVDVTAAGSTGKQAETALGTCGITVNMNMIPFDKRKPLDPSGIRIGTPALTTRGMGPAQMRDIAMWIVSAVKNPDNRKRLEEIRRDVSALCAQFPVPAAAVTV
jgi:glycine hydroxymethyltransferase